MNSRELHLTLTNATPPEELVEASRARLLAYAKLLRHRAEGKTGHYAMHEDALRLPVDAALEGEVTHAAQRLWNNRLKYVIVIGIGGSNLGTEAVYQAAYGKSDLLRERTPKLLVLDTVTPRMLRDVTRALLRSGNADEFAIDIVSKSGTTTETVANADILLAALTEHFGDISSRIVVTTEHGSPLAQWAERKGIAALSIPAKIGGRFSVMSAVGLLPLALCGVDIAALRAGAHHVTHSVTEGHPVDDPALRLALAIYAAYKKGVHMLDLFFWDPDLEMLGKWTRQLISESLGKEHDRKGLGRRLGITPTVSIGSVDLHSMVQLDLAGPRDKFTLFVRRETEEHMHIARDAEIGEIVRGLPGKDTADILDALYGGTIAAFKKRELPFAELTLPGAGVDAIGAYMTLMMATVMYLAELMDLNAFDQPAVEEYKRETRRILESSK